MAAAKSNSSSFFADSYSSSEDEESVSAAAAEPSQHFASSPARRTMLPVPTASTTEETERGFSTGVCDHGGKDDADGDGVGLAGTRLSPSADGTGDGRSSPLADEGGATIDAIDQALIFGFGGGADGQDNAASDGMHPSDQQSIESGEVVAPSSSANSAHKVDIDNSLFEASSDEDDIDHSLFEASSDEDEGKVEGPNHNIGIDAKPAEAAYSTCSSAGCVKNVDSRILLEAAKDGSVPNGEGGPTQKMSTKRKRPGQAPKITSSAPKADEDADKAPLTAAEALARARQRQNANIVDLTASPATAASKPPPSVPRKRSLSKSAPAILAEARARRGQSAQGAASSSSATVAAASISKKRALPGYGRSRGPSPPPPPLSNPLHRGPAFYPRIELENFWRSMRNWDFVADFNDYMRASRGGGRGGGGGGEKEKGAAESTATSRTMAQPLPDRFDSAEQYKALWAPLLLGESKSQILSDVSASLSGGGALGATRVKVQPVSQSSGRDHSECITVQVREASGTVVGGGAVGPFSVNDTVLLVRDDSVITSASRGTLLKDTAEKMTSSLIGTSRWGLVGTVMNRTRKLDGLLVKVSKKYWNTCNVPEMYLVMVGYNVTALREFTALCAIDSVPLTNYLLAKDLIQSSGNNKVTTSSSQHSSDLLSEAGGENALGIGFRIYAKSKFNHSQLEAITVAAREYGDGGFTLVKGPPGTGKTTTLVALLNALHLRQYQRYYKEIERIATEAKVSSAAEDLAAIHAAGKVKPRILVCAPSNAAVDNVILKLIEVRFVDGNGGRYSPSIVRVGKGLSPHVRHVSLDAKVDAILAEGAQPEKLEASIVASRKELRRMQGEIRKLQRRIRALAAASPYPLSPDWEIRVDEANFDHDARRQVIYVNHRNKSVTYDRPPPPSAGEIPKATTSMPHYKACVDSLVKYVERHNALSSKLEQNVLVQNTAANISSGNYNQATSQLNQDLETQILDSEHIVLTTLGSAGSKTVGSATRFEVVVVDEAAQSSEPSTLIALHLGSSHAILIGDPQQLPATIFSESGRITKYDRSLFQRLEEAGHPVHMLNTQFRMNPAISEFPRKIFYDEMLLDGPNVKSPAYGGELTQVVKANFPYFQHFTILDVDSSEERDGTSLSNASEAQLALHLFSSLKQETEGLASQSRVAIIAPYSQQVALLRRLFADKLGESYTNQVDISTVDAFQGKEAKIVIFSCVRAAGKGVGIGFLSDVQRMNVALTRAQHFLFVIARCRTVVVNPYWRDLVRHAREKNAIINVPIFKIGKKRKHKGGKRLGPSFPDLKTLVPFHNSIENQPPVPNRPGDGYDSEGEFSA